MLDRVEIYRRTLVGALALVMRQAFLFPIGAAVSVLLARLLAPADFGTFATVLFLVSSTGIVVDLGLGAALIRRPEEPNPREIGTLFTFRFLAMASALLLIYLGAPMLVRFFHMAPGSDRLTQLVASSLLLIPVSRTSRELLSRRLGYRALASIDVAQSMVYQVVALSLAWAGYHVWGLAFAYLSAALAETVLLFRVARWRVQFAWDPVFLRYAVGYGGLLLLAGIAALLRDNIPILLAGPLFGPGAVGYLNWASNLVRQLTQVLTSAVTQVSFPSLSRLQEDRAALSRMVNAIIRSSNLVTLPLLASACALGPSMVHVLYTDKWAPGLPAFYLLAAGAIGKNLATPLENVLKATGRADALLRITSGWMVVDWLLAVMAVAVGGFTGVAAAYAAGAWIAAWWLLSATARFCHLNLYPSLIRPLIASSLGCASTLILKGLWVTTIPTLLLAGCLSIAISWLFLLALERASLLGELRTQWLLARTVLASRKRVV